jgi:hypothetical protein
MENSREVEKKAPKGKSESLWSLHMRSFWKTRSTNPPEVKGKLFNRSFSGRTMMGPRYQNLPFWSMGKCEVPCHGKPFVQPDNSRDGAEIESPGNGQSAHRRQWSAAELPSGEAPCWAIWAIFFDSYSPTFCAQRINAPIGRHSVLRSKVALPMPRAGPWSRALGTHRAFRPKSDRK